MIQEMMTSAAETEYLVVLCTCPNAKLAEQLANLVIKEHCAACVNIISNLTSVYRWEGQITQSAEYLLIIKTHSEKYTKLENILRTYHEYQIPEIIALPIHHGLDTYLNWIKESLHD